MPNLDATCLGECLFQSFFFDRGPSRGKSAKHSKLNLPNSSTPTAAVALITPKQPNLLKYAAAVGVEDERRFNFDCEAMRQQFGQKRLSGCRNNPIESWIIDKSH